MKNTLLTLSALTLICTALPASAQMADPAAQQRIDRLERDLMLMQRQISRGDPVSVPSGPAASEGGARISEGAIDNPAQLDVKLSSIEEEMRRLRGKVEEVEFANKRNAELIDKMQKDTEFRFNELSQNKAPVAPGTAPVIAAPTTEGSLQAPDAPAAPDAAAEEFSSPKEHYNYAFRLLNQTKYDDAAKAFDGFTKKYPKDPLVGNAYYWQGETHYIRGDYVASADSFRQGFEALPTGPKAADNLLKLAMSLSALSREKEACVVLTQLGAKFKKTSASTVEKAAQEQKRIGCK